MTFYERVVKFVNQFRSPPNTYWMRGPHVPGAVPVTPLTAMNYSAVFACQRVIAETLATLPWEIFERRPDGTTVARPDHPVYYLLNVRPNSDVPAMVFREQIIMNMLAWGNAFAEIQYANNGYPYALWQIPSENVVVERDPQTSELVYHVAGNLNSAYKTLPANQVLHWRNIGCDGVMGLSTIALAANTISFGLEMDSFGARFFQNAPFLSGWLEYPQKLPDKQRTDQLKRSWQEKYAGWGRAGEIAILEGGMSFKQLSMPMKDAEFLSSRTFQIQEIARWYRVPQHKIGVLEEASYANIEALEIDCANETFLPMCIRLEQETDYKLLSGAQRTSKFVSKHNLTQILRGDLKSRSEAYATGLRYGWYSINDVRQLESLNPIAGGDLRTVQLNTVPLEQFQAMADVKLEQAKLDAQYREEQIEQLQLGNEAAGEQEPASPPDANVDETGESEAGGAQDFEPSQAPASSDDITRATMQARHLKILIRPQTRERGVSVGPTDHPSPLVRPQDDTTHHTPKLAPAANR